MFIKVFTVYIRSKLECAAPVWSTHLRKHIELQEKVQHRRTKTVHEIRELSYKDRLAPMEFPTFEERGKSGDIITTQVSE